MVIFNELWACRYFKLSMFTVAVLIFQTFMVLALRGAYLIDAFGGLAFGHFFWILAMWLSYYIDVKLLDLSMQERFPEFPKECGRCDAPINNWLKNPRPVEPRDSDSD